MKCHICPNEIDDRNTEIFVKCMIYFNKLRFCSVSCKREYLKRVIGKKDFKELDFNEKGKCV